MKNKIMPFAPKEKTRTISKLATIILLLITISIVSITKAGAHPLFIDVDGFVNFSAGTITDNGSTTTFGQVDYTFDVVDITQGFGLVNLDLTFDNDVFSSIGSLALSPSITSGWAFSSHPHSGITEAHLSGSAVQSLTFSMLGVEIYNEALTDPSLWSGDGVGEQEWSTVIFDNDGHFDTNGGNTIPNPEPASLILMGTGLVGLGLWSRRRKKD